MNYAVLSHRELFTACANSGDAAGWQEFISRFNPVIVRSVARIATRYGNCDNTLIDDLVQDTYVKICAQNCKVLRNFTPHAEESAFGFLKVVAANVAQDFFKSRLAEKRNPGPIAEVTDSNPAPQVLTGGLSSIERAVLIEQIDRRLKAAVPLTELNRARTVFWLYYRAGLTASAIATLPSIALTTEGVESLLLRLTRTVRQGLSGGDSPKAVGEKGFQQAESF